MAVHAEAFGEAQEHGLLIPMLEGARESFRELELAEDVLKDAVMADAGYCNEANAKLLFETGVDGYLRHAVSQARSTLCHRRTPQTRN